MRRTDACRAHVLALVGEEGGEVALGGKGALDAVEGCLRVGGDGVVVVTARDGEQRRALAALDVVEEAQGVSEREDVELGRESAVDSVAHGDVEHLPVALENREELVGGLGHGVAHLDDTGVAGRLGACDSIICLRFIGNERGLGHGRCLRRAHEHVAARGRHDVVALGAQERHVLHDHLTAHAEYLRERTARQRSSGAA